jgi:DNA-binding beta-propeller fold protein YncE
MRIRAFDSSGRRPTRLLRLAGVAVAALALSAVAFAGRANAFVYWTSPGLSNNASGVLGRANLDGTNANDTFESSVNYPQAVAVDPADGYMYWTTNLLGGTIARAKLNGTDVNEEFITGISNPAGVAVDSTDGYIYWSNSVPHGASTIGRANLDGTGINRSLITTLLPASGVAVDSANGYVYWTTPGSPTNASGLIGRAKLDGSGVNNTFESSLHYPQAIAVDSADGYIYWTTNLLGGTIARAPLNSPTNKNEEFIPDVSSPAGVAVDSTDGYIYWSNSVPHGASTIGRAKLDGSGANPRFINVFLPAGGLATDNLSSVGGPPPTPTIAALIADVKKLGRSHRIERSLIAKLHAAQRSLDSIHIGKARGHLGAFMDEVRTDRGKKIHAAKAKKLINTAVAIRKALGCRAHHCRRPGP